MSEPEVSEAQVLERAKGVDDPGLGGGFPAGRSTGGLGRAPGKEGERFRNRERENVCDRFTLVADFESGLVVTGAVAFRAGKVEVREELHLYLLKSIAGAPLTAASAGIKGEITGLDSSQLPVRGTGKELSHEIEGSQVDNGRGAGSAGEGALVHDPCICELFRARERTKRCRVLLALDAKRAGQVLVEDIVDEGGLA